MPRLTVLCLQHFFEDLLYYLWPYIFDFEKFAHIQIAVLCSFSLDSFKICTFPLGLYELIMVHGRIEIYTFFFCCLMYINIFFHI